MSDISIQPRLRGLLRTARPWLLALLVTVLAAPSLAQDGTGPAPENAQDRRYGSGWDCDPGFRIAGGVCVALAIPENAYPTGRSHGTGWACRHGYLEVRGAACEAVAIPANAFLDASGLGWDCARGFEARQATCIAIELPENAHLDRSGNRWQCNRGFHLSEAGLCILKR